MHVPVGVAFIVDLHLLVVESLFFFFLGLVGFLLPLVLLSLQSFLETSVVEVVLLFLVVLPFGAVVHVVVLVEPFLFWVWEAVPLTAREDCSGGLKMRVPAVWKRAWNPTA